MPSVAALAVLCLAFAGELRADEPTDDPACPERSCPDTRWEAPRIAGAYDFLPGPHRPFQVVVDPVSWNTGAWNLGPVIAVTAPVTISDGLTMDAWHLQLGTWFMPSSPKARWRAGPELGLCLRSFSDGEREIARDWLPAFGGRVGLSWLMLERWRLEPGFRVVAELPPTELILVDGIATIPTWRAQFFLGLHLPTPGR